MCGIAGILNHDNAPIDSDLLVAMRERLFSRGPDDAGLWIKQSTGLAHRRLSILDLSARGRQPMFDPVSQNVIVFNGEVYNFRQLRKTLEAEGITFDTQTDTEVVLKTYRLWGQSCVEQFIGMFAFAIWDENKKGLFLARDRLGIKPLYYHAGSSHFLFASRLKSLLAHPACPRQIDTQALSLYLQAGYVPAPLCILTGINKLQPGQTLWLRHGQTEPPRIRNFWSVDKITTTTPAALAALDDNSINPHSNTDDNKAADRLESLLIDAVRLRLISDVPLGAFLSGGIDSSLVVAIMAKQLSTKPKTFTIGFEESAFDETAFARKIAQTLGTDHHQQIMHHDSLINLLDDNAEHYDEPFADWSSLPTMLVSRFARKHVTVCLSGDGGDELFCGYPYYRILRMLKPFYHAPAFLRKSLGLAIRQLGTHKTSLLASSLQQENLDAAFTFIRSMIKNFSLQNLTCQNHHLPLNTFFARRSSAFAATDPISRASRLDICYYLPDDILQKVDVASMSVGLEARVPLLDHRVVEFSQSLPLHYKIRNGRSKWLLRKVLARYLPESLFDRPKAGFEVPIRDWFRNELKDMLRDELSPTRIKNCGYLQPAAVQHLIDLHLSGRRDTHPMLWSILSFLRWHDRLTHNWKALK